MGKIVVPLMKRVPRTAASLFARTWAQLLLAAVHDPCVWNWAWFFMFPKVALLALFVLGMGFRRKNIIKLSKFLIVNDSGLKPSMEEVVSSKSSLPAPSLDSLQSREKAIQSAAVAALRDNDVQKALRIITDAPLAPKNVETLNELQNLHLAVNLIHLLKPQNSVLNS